MERHAAAPGRGKLPCVRDFVLPWHSLAVLLTACGYHAVYGAERPTRLHVELVRTFIPDVIASDEVASGVREELAREGALEPGHGWPRVEIEVLRAGEATTGAAGGGGVLLARGTEVAILAHAWISPAPGAAPRHDTGDMRAAVVIGVDESLGKPDALAGGFHYEDALRAAARRVGHKLAQSLLGQPVASENVVDR